MELKISKRGGSSLKRTTVLEQRSEDSGLHPHVLAMLPWPGYTTSLKLSFLFSKVTAMPTYRILLRHIIVDVHGTL